MVYMWNSSLNYEFQKKSNVQNCILYWFLALKIRMYMTSIQRQSYSGDSSELQLENLYFLNMKKHNLKEQLKALIKKDDDSLNFCYTYYWTNNKVRGMDDIAFFDEIKDHKDKALIKRCQCYSNQKITISGQDYCLFMVSFGDKMMSKFYYGQNPLAKALGRCLFDNVYVFVEEPLLAQKKIEGRIKQLLKQNKVWNAQILYKSLQKLFPNSPASDNLKQLMYGKELGSEQQQQLTPNQKSDQCSKQKN